MALVQEPCPAPVMALLGFDDPREGIRQAQLPRGGQAVSLLSPPAYARGELSPYFGRVFIDTTPFRRHGAKARLRWGSDPTTSWIWEPMADGRLAKGGAHCLICSFTPKEARINLPGDFTPSICERFKVSPDPMGSSFFPVNPSKGLKSSSRWPRPSRTALAWNDRGHQWFQKYWHSHRSSTASGRLPVERLRCAQTPSRHHPVARLEDPAHQLGIVHQPFIELHSAELVAFPRPRFTHQLDGPTVQALQPEVSVHWPS